MHRCKHETILPIINPTRYIEFDGNKEPIFKTQAYLLSSEYLVHKSRASNNDKAP